MADEQRQGDSDVPCIVYKFSEAVATLIAAAYTVAFERGHNYLLVREVCVPNDWEVLGGDAEGPKAGKIIFIDGFGDERVLVMAEIESITTKSIACQYEFDIE